MVERPILMNAFSVNAILEGKKTQTRRVMKPENVIDCPYGAKKDSLWVREAWAPVDKLVNGYDLDSPEWIMFRADGALWNSMIKVYADRGALIDPPKWKPSIFMPKYVSRITLEIVSVRAEQVQEISLNDVLAEGIPAIEINDYPWKPFSDLWDSINEKRGYSWAQNPWVWVVEFKLLKGA